jgi:hypothetical protein
VDVLISFAWFAAFGILVNAIQQLPCGSIWHWNGFLHDSVCGRWKAAEAMSFVSAILWLVSALVVGFFLDCNGRPRANDGHRGSGLPYVFARILALLLERK